MERPPLFTNKDLAKLLLPLFIEQILAVTIGIADTIMVASCGESAVSAVSLIDSLNLLLVQLFTALATGGAVITAQYIGRNEKHNANIAAKQLIYVSTFIAVIISLVSIIFNNQIIRLIFGNIEPDVMSNSIRYYYIIALSFPFLAIYNACSSLFRAVGNSRVSMIISVLMNIINITGNAFLIYGVRIGVRGAATATLAARIVGALIMLILIMKKTSDIHVDNLFTFKFKPDMIKRILNIGIPNGLENSMFQIGKLVLASLITTFGTAAIAANAVSNTVASFPSLPGSAIGLSMITVVGRCVGAKEYEQAKKYAVKLMAIMYVTMGFLSVILFFVSPGIVKHFNLSPLAHNDAITIIRQYAILSMLIWPVSFGLPNALRAAGDTKFTMVVSALSMWIFRIGCSYILSVYFNLGLKGIWYAMYIDWIARATTFIIRFKSEKWKGIKVI